MNSNSSCVNLVSEIFAFHKRNFLDNGSVCIQSWYQVAWSVPVDICLSVDDDLLCNEVLTIE